MLPAKAIRQSEGHLAGTRVVPSNTLLDRAPVPHRRGRWVGGFWGLGPPVCSYAACHQITLTLVGCEYQLN